MDANDYLQIRNSEGVSTTAQLVGERLVVGRTQGVEIVLDSQTVSRRHAEFYKDPWGAWHVRDLGSRNGTKVNGTFVEDHTLQIGDVVEVEDYTLTYRVRRPTQSGGRLPRSTAAGLTLTDMTTGPVRSIRELPTPKIDATHVHSLHKFGGQMRRIPDEQERLQSLCALMVSTNFNARSACALRLYKDQRDDPQPDMLCEPVLATGQTESPYFSRTLIRNCIERETAMIAVSGDSGAAGGEDAVELSMVSTSDPLAVIAAPIGNEDEYLDVLYVVMPGRYGSPEWSALVALAAEQYEGATADWERQKQQQHNALIESELERAHAIQMRYVPKDFVHQTVGVGFGFVPCKWVGGDYVDALPMKDGKLFLTVMDVCGKGMQAALITSSLHTTIHLLMKQNLPLTEIVGTLNSHLCETLPDESFVTACCMILDPVLLSTPIEPNREFQLDWGGLDVSIQKTVTFKRRWRHRGAEMSTSFVDPLYVHVPYDTTRQLNALQPDVVMSLELGARSLGAVRYCRRNAKSKSVLCTYMSEHSELNRGWARESLRRHLIRRADAITYNGPSCRRYLQRMGADTDRLYRLAYAADDRTAYQGDVSRDEAATRSRFLYVGQLTDRKGVLPMIRHLAAYCIENPNRHIDLRLAGEGPLRNAIDDIAKPSNLTVQLLGRVPADQLSDQMLQCGVTIAPTLADEWLLVVNEALQAGLPVIGSIYAQATTTLIRDGINGWQYDPVDPNSLAKQLDRYFALPSTELESMRIRCRQSIEHCTPDWAAEGAVHAIADLAAQTDSRPGAVR